MGQKIISGFLLAVLLMAAVGYFGIRTSNKTRESSVVEAEMSSLALKVAEKGTIIKTATLTKNLDELAQLEENANKLRDEIDGVSSTLLKDPNIKDSVDFPSFLVVKNDHNKDQERVFSIHRELLERQALFGDSPSVEEAVRQRLRAVIDTTNNLELARSFRLVEVLSKEALFQYRNKKSVDRWTESIRKLRSNIGGENRALSDHVTVYLQTAEIVGDIVVREGEINTDENNLISTMRVREVELGTLRKKIVDELSANTSRVYQNNNTILILVVVGMLVLMGSTGFFFSQRIIKPITELTAVAVEIAGGNLGARAGVFSTDEIGILARSFNQMTDRLAEYPLRLQQEVERKTRELIDINVRLEELLRENDISAKMLVRRDIELTEADARLSDLDTMKSEFVSIAAHQLRTPLTGIRWTFDSLLKGEYGKLVLNQEKVLEIGLESSLRMIQLINDLLDVARIEEGRFGLHPRKQSFTKVIEAAVNNARQMAEEKGITLLCDIAPHIPFVFFDDEKMMIAFANIVDNAVKYTLPGGKITVTVLLADKNVNIVVADTGIGIPKDQIDHVFSKFFRADNALRLQTAGNGLGMYVVKNIVEGHGGSITIVSDEGKGTIITITLPVTAPNAR